MSIYTLGVVCASFFWNSSLNAEIVKPDRIGFAITMLLIGMTTVATTDLISKSIIPLISIWQLLALRSMVGLLFLLSILISLKKLPTIKTINLVAVLCRSFLMTTCYVCFFLALAKIPIALVAGAFFCGPFFMVILSRFMLGETFGIWRSTSLVGGFVGVILILQPTSVEFDSHMILALLSAFLYALTQVVTRKYCKKEDPAAISCWLTITFLFSGCAGMLVLWLLPSLLDTSFINRPTVTMPLLPFLALTFIGVCSIIIHYCLSAAYQNAPSSLIGPLEYIYLPLAAVGGYFFYNEIPNLTALIGILIIIAAGLIVAWRKDA